jgi:hypothetical protein
VQWFQAKYLKPLDFSSQGHQVQSARSDLRSTMSRDSEPGDLIAE